MRHVDTCGRCRTRSIVGDVIGLERSGDDEVELFHGDSDVHCVVGESSESHALEEIHFHRFIVLAFQPAVGIRIREYARNEFSVMQALEYSTHMDSGTLLGLAPK